ncbi:hypothetical protein [Paraburkholderia dilworthii]|uniref:hypothetical protein n=1 Tax=Paraburkholderia dilworthii TaxID=948106 RepID=UPI0012B5DA80|nr:hypothetical protein [Paraburkholderia dilworthii]
MRQPVNNASNDMPMTRRRINAKFDDGMRSAAECFQKSVASKRQIARVLLKRGEL